MRASLVLLALVTACGGRLSDAARADLAVETQRCLLQEREIVDRMDTSELEDREALRIERARCDAARAAIVEGSAP